MHLLVHLLYTGNVVMDFFGICPISGSIRDWEWHRMLRPTDVEAVGIGLAAS